MDEQNFKFNYVFQGQDCTLSTGVYKITIQNHVYIGSAAISFRKRWRQHQLDFIRDIHHSRFAQNAFNKYGIATFEIMELCPRELCIEREQWWIDTLKPDLNIQKIADSALGVKRTEEAIAKRTAKQVKTIYQYDLDGNLIKVWDSINSIENGTDYKRKTIYACANGQNSTAYGYVWKYCR